MPGNNKLSIVVVNASIKQTMSVAVANWTQASGVCMCSNPRNSKPLFSAAAHSIVATNAHRVPSTVFLEFGQCRLPIIVPSADAFFFKKNEQMWEFPDNYLYWKTTCSPDSFTTIKTWR